jgi:uncharacterized alkaline shock family protein YloU
VTVVLHEDGGAVSLTASALQQLVVQAAESVDGTKVRRGRRRLDVEVAGGRARVELELAVRYGVVMPEAGRDVQTRVAEALRTMLGVEVDAVDVTIDEVET